MPRPEISEETKEAVESLTEGDFNVPDTKVSFEDRLRLLTQKYENLQQEVQKQQNIANQIQQNL